MFSRVSTRMLQVIEKLPKVSYSLSLMAVSVGLMCTPSLAATYYVKETGNDVATGLTPGTAWKTLNRVTRAMDGSSGYTQLQPGDSVLLERGGVWGDQGDQDFLTIQRSGSSAASPITFGAYGETSYALPRIVSYRRNATLVELKNVQHIVVENWALENRSGPVQAGEVNPSNSDLGSVIAWNGFFINSGSSQNIIRNCEALEVARGVEIQGSNNRVQNCYFHDLRLAKNTSTPTYDDYGANGILVSSSNNVITGNRFERCRDVSLDYGFDGGAIEVWAKSGGANNNLIFGNMARDCDGFIEIGGESSSLTCNNLRIAYNIIVQNRGIFLYLQRVGNYGIRTSDLQVDNNTIFEDTSAESDPDLNTYLIEFNQTDSSVPANLPIKLRNNILLAGPALSSTGSRPRRITYGNAVFAENKHNLFFYNGTMPTNFLGGASGGVNNLVANPKFVAAPTDFHLSTNGQSPAIGSGLSGLGYTVDYEGKPLSSPPSCGALDASDGSVISIDFRGGSSTNGTPAAMSNGEVAGAIPAAYWNTAAGASSGSSPVTNLKNSSGSSTAASVAWTSSSTWSTAITETPGNPRMMKGYLSTTDTSVTTITVSGLPADFNANGYDVYVYFDGSNGSASRVGRYSLSSNYVTGTDGPNEDFSGTWEDGTNFTGNYVKFSVNSGTGFSLSATPVSASDNVKRAPVNGIQIVRH